MSSDHWEISNLIGRYAELLNLGRIDEVAGLFRHGRITGDGMPDVVGSDAVAAMYRNSVHFGEKIPDTLIITSNLQIEVDGDSATSKAYYTAVHELRPGVVAPVIAGRYHDEFRKIDGTWWFQRRHMYPDLRGDLSTHLRKPLGTDVGTDQ